MLFVDDWPTGSRGHLFLMVNRTEKCGKWVRIFRPVPDVMNWSLCQPMHLGWMGLAKWSGIDGTHAAVNKDVWG